MVRKMTRCSECSSESIHCSAIECHFLCVHMYMCDSRCFDYTNGHICKHIHRVHSLLQDNSSAGPLEEVTNGDDHVFYPQEPNTTIGTTY